MLLIQKIFLGIIILLIVALSITMLFGRVDIRMKNQILLGAVGLSVAGIVIYYAKPISEYLLVTLGIDPVIIFAVIMIIMFIVLSIQNKIFQRYR